MKDFLVIILLIAGTVTISCAQVEKETREVEPVGGSSKLALRYFRINFNALQRERLAGREVELIFSVDTTGVALLEHVNGVSEQPILDSLNNVALPIFYPRTVEGRREESIYFLKLTFPAYDAVNPVLYSSPLHFRRAYDMDEFEYIRKSGRRMDMLIGGMLNGFGGNAARYSGTGGGMKLDMIFTGENNLGLGMVMAFYGNPRTRDYPVVTTRPQNPSRVTLLLGGAINKHVRVKDRKELSLQLELAYALQNIVTRNNTQDVEYLQANGFSPGVSVNFALPLGRERLSYYYAMPCLYSHYVNFHVAIRPVFYDLKQASGMIWEAGISYRLGWNFVDEYLLKDD